MIHCLLKLQLTYRMYTNFRGMYVNFEDITNPAFHDYIFKDDMTIIILLILCTFFTMRGCTCDMVIRVSHIISCKQHSIKNSQEILSNLHPQFTIVPIQNKCKIVLVYILNKTISETTSVAAASKVETCHCVKSTIHVYPAL